MHFEDGIVYAEPGIDIAALEAAGTSSRRFGSRNLFFGGVQAAERDRDGRFWGGGDPRRGGAAIVVSRVSRRMRRPRPRLAAARRSAGLGAAA